MKPPPSTRSIKSIQSTRQFIPTTETQTCTLKPLISWGKNPKPFQTVRLTGHFAPALRGKWLLIGVNDDGTYRLKRWLPPVKKKQPRKS